MKFLLQWRLGEDFYSNLLTQEQVFDTKYLFTEGQKFTWFFGEETVD